ncbi:putative signal transducing protein [Aestuariibaculum suncheonense]|uniref:DUF2007 domain-containing protein n=1 Tax=Aestuariibaculum suncheonense TaxID=1028745 RepID=A0A8J6QXM5_9FLAO|nr:DUF2007 domain-containing protein [Aestuariibaculum suncheonense]MBD0836379.1 DUF2007 domain-containing protein [Aestuariibaculum suncheonense]
MKFITIKKSHFETDLLILKGRLESEGIVCFLKNQYTTQTMNYMPTFEVELQVLEKDLDQVQSLMLEIENN